MFPMFRLIVFPVNLKLSKISADHSLWDSPEAVGAGDGQSQEDPFQSLDQDWAS